ncbi:hypothetical protein NPIL_509081 [Nephila pilipes]|uniref:Uncharacterized protein n=1 Tax=Nephila pilipes TaxID=299642 RepID=A0A8X6N5C9_NEPPI|nr:hypothetical protein NPIL_509081 [Nephila pilipes]
MRSSSVVSGMISNEAPSKSPNVRLDASDPCGTLILHSNDAGYRVILYSFYLLRVQLLHAAQWLLQRNVANSILSVMLCSVMLQSFIAQHSHEGLGQPTRIKQER